MEKDISEDIKEDIFLSMLFDEALEHRELTQKDVDGIDHRIKKGFGRENCAEYTNRNKDIKAKS